MTSSFFSPAFSAALSFSTELILAPLSVFSDTTPKKARLPAIAIRGKLSPLIIFILPAIGAILALILGIKVLSELKPLL